MAKTADAARIQTRIDYLKRVRPNDPEIARQQAKLQALNANVPPGDAALRDVQVQPTNPTFGLPGDQYTGPNASVGGAPPTLDFNDPNFKSLQDSIFAQLTPHLDEDYQRAKMEKEAELRGKGIPFSADPNSRWQQEIGRMGQDYEATKLSARNTALTTAVGSMIDLEKLTDADLDRMVLQGKITSDQRNAIKIARITSHRTGASQPVEEDTGFYM